MNMNKQDVMGVKSLSSVIFLCILLKLTLQALSLRGNIMPLKIDLASPLAEREYAIKNRPCKPSC